MDKRHYYKEPNILKRKVSERFGDGENNTVTHPDGLYNPNLTIAELCLLRTLIWETRDQDIDVLNILHRWLFAKEAPEPLFYQDILNVFTKGQKIRFDEIVED